MLRHIIDTIRGYLYNLNTGGGKMKTVKITRAFRNDKVTLGMLKVLDTDHDPIYTLENPWRNNEDWLSCIPCGLYDTSPYDSAKYPKTYKLDYVKDRDDILIHWGNYEKNTQGCILLGLGSAMMNSQPSIQSSKKAVEYFNKLIGRNKFTLIIGE